MVEALDAASDLVSDVDAGATWQLSEGGLEQTMSLLARLRADIDRIEVAVAAEASERGVGARGGRTPIDWAMCAEGAQSPRPDVSHVARVFRVAQACGRPRLAGLAEAFRSGALPVAQADRIAAFERDVRLVADPDVLAEHLDTLVAAASDSVDDRGDVVHGLTLRELSQAIRYATQLLKPPRGLEDEEARMRSARSLRRSAGPAGMTTYHLLLDPEGASVVDAAVSALSAPRTVGQDGERDARTPATRRADALLEVIGRGVASPGATPKADRAQVLVTISLESLLEQVEHAGLTAGGEILSAAAVRRMACDAGIVPMVLGSEGEVLDVGRTVRLFTPGQRRALVRRDAGCSYPGCTVPADWCEAHHVTWWSRGGPTSVANGALLCQRHHTRVHTLDLTATVTPTKVRWHLDAMGHR
jgi:hypothetical protein